MGTGPNEGGSDQPRTGRYGPLDGFATRRLESEPMPDALDYRTAVDDPIDDPIDGSDGDNPTGDPVGEAAPTAGMVLHRVLALAARTFLLNDPGDESADQHDTEGLPDALASSLTELPTWARQTSDALAATVRRGDRVDRIHQTRVAMRRTRSNLRTFRLLLDPSWGTTLRAELAWYGNELGRSRDLDVLADVIDMSGPDVLDEDEIAILSDIVDDRRAEAMAHISAEQAGPRRSQLTEQMLHLWEGPPFKAKSGKPAIEVLPSLLERAWRDVRGAARSAKKSNEDADLHQLRIRLKDLRYGCETVALVAGSPAKKTAKAAEALQSKLGDLHDAQFSIEWLDALTITRPDLADPVGRLIGVQREAEVAARKGWKKDLKAVEQRWRAWLG